MGKKRSREADGKTADPVDQDADRMDEDSGEVRTISDSYTTRLTGANNLVLGF